MTDPILDTLRTLILAAILATLLHAGARRDLDGPPGWRAIVGGFALLLCASALGTLRGLPVPLPGEGARLEPLLDLIERVVGLLGGACLLAWGLWRWLPVVAATRANQRELLRLKERYRAISATTSDLNIDAEVLPDGSLRVDWISGSLHSASGYTPDDIMTVEQWQRIVLPEDLPLLESHLAAAGAGEGRRTELRARTRDGRVLWLALATCPRREPDSPALWLTTAVRDISARKQAEADTLRSLEENRTLLRELHHRVKNNLQVITGLVELAKSRIKDADPEVVAACQDLQARIGCMALVHGQLYADGATGRVDFGLYARDLAAQTAKLHGREATRFDLELDEVPLTLDAAVPCGLALNELLTNAFRHARPGGPGRIALTVRARGGELLVRVSDDGPGAPAEARDPASQGLRLLRNLVTLQLRGSVEFSPGPGATATMRLPLERDADAAPLPSPRP